MSTAATSISCYYHDSSVILGLSGFRAGLNNIEAEAVRRGPIRRSFGIVARGSHEGREKSDPDRSQVA